MGPFGPHMPCPMGPSGPCCRARAGFKLALPLRDPGALEKGSPVNPYRDGSVSKRPATSASSARTGRSARKLLVLPGHAVAHRNNRREKAEIAELLGSQGPDEFVLQEAEK